MNVERMHQVTKLAGDDFQPGPPPLGQIQRRARSTVIRRRVSVGVTFAAVGLVGVAGVIGTGVLPHHGHAQIVADSFDLGPLSQAQFTMAANVAQEQLAGQPNAHITAANATILTEKVDGNVAPCPVPTVRVSLIGAFPDVNLGSPPDDAGDGSNADTGVTSLLVTLDATSGAVCQVGVSTGTPHVYAGAANLLPALDLP